MASTITTAPTSQMMLFMICSFFSYARLRGLSFKIMQTQQDSGRQ